LLRKHRKITFAVFTIVPVFFKPPFFTADFLATDFFFGDFAAAAAAGGCAAPRLRSALSPLGFPYP
jgi:hypothetical protein